MRYRVPFDVHAKRARTKARLAYYMQWGGGYRYYPVPSSRARFVEFDAPSHAAASRMLQSLILPRDPRPILGRTNIKLFCVG
jgi:hypothetical protein